MVVQPIEGIEAAQFIRDLNTTGIVHGVTEPFVYAYSEVKYGIGNAFYTARVVAISLGLYSVYRILK